MAHPTISEDEARDLFARQLDELRAERPAPDSEARLAAIFAKSEEDCRDLEAWQGIDGRRAALSSRR